MPNLAMMSNVAIGAEKMALAILPMIVGSAMADDSDCDYLLEPAGILYNGNHACVVAFDVLPTKASESQWLG